MSVVLESANPSDRDGLLGPIVNELIVSVIKDVAAVRNAAVAAP